jgi:hypothetical protein
LSVIRTDNSCRSPKTISFSRFPRRLGQPRRPAIEHVPDRKEGIPPQHARAGKPHHLANLFAKLRLVTVDRTGDACRLVLPERAAVQSADCVPVQFLAFGTQLASRSVAEAAENAEHRRDCLFLPRDPFGTGWRTMFAGR